MKGHEASQSSTTKNAARKTAAVTTIRVMSGEPNQSSLTFFQEHSKSLQAHGHGSDAPPVAAAHTRQVYRSRACHEFKFSVLNRLLSNRLVKASQCSPARVAGNRS